MFGYTVRHKNYLVTIADLELWNPKPVIRKQFDTETEARSYIEWLKTCGNPKDKNRFAYYVEKNDLKRNIGVDIT
jgi:hypothetical protein